VTADDKKDPSEPGIEYRATIRFPRKDYEFMQKLIENGEYTNITEIVRDAVKRFRFEWTDIERIQNLVSMPFPMPLPGPFPPMPPGMHPMMGMGMMPRTKRMMKSVKEAQDDDKDDEQ